MFFLCLCGSDYCKTKDNYWKDYLSKENTLIYKGLFSILVVLHHLYIELHIASIFDSFFTIIGPIAVMMFFFFSGYGVMCNWINNKNYDKKFLFKRLGSIVPLYIFAIIVYWVGNKALGINYTAFDVINSFLNGSPMVLHSWYIFVIVAFYLLFFIQMKIFKNNYKGIVLSSIILCVIWIMFRKDLNYAGWWSNYILSIPLGMIWALYKDKVDKYLFKSYWLICVMTLLLLIILPYFVLDYETSMYIKSLILPILVLLIFMKLKIGNKVLKFFGTISLEIYIFHGLFCNLLFVYTDLLEIGEMIYTLIAITSSILFSAMVNFTYNKIKQLLIYNSL